MAGIPRGPFRERHLLTATMRPTCPHRTRTTTPRLWLLLSFVLLFLLRPARALELVVSAADGPNGTCLVETLHASQSVSANFYPSDWALEQVACTVTGPDGAVVVRETTEQDGRLVFTAAADGEYVFCFVPRAERAAVHFEVNTYVFPELQNVVHKERVDRTEASILGLARSLQAVKQQARMVMHAHVLAWNAALANQSRMRVCTVLELVLLVLTLAWQMRQVHRMFQTKPPRPR